MKHKKISAYFNDNRKYLSVLAIFVLVAFCIYFSYAFKSVEETLLKELVWEKQQDLKLLSGVVDMLVEKDKEMGHRAVTSYDEVLKFAVQYIEANYNFTFAQVFDEDLNPLTSTSPGVGGGKKHNPLDYPEFVEAVKNNESGSLVYWYETEQAGGRYIHINFIWVPTDKDHLTRYLVAVGVSKFTVKEDMNDMVVYGAVALIAVTAVLIITTVVLLVRLGYIYEQRKGGDKWREER